MKKQILDCLKKCVAFFLVMLLLPLPAMAAEGIELSTNYPGIVARPGEFITFPLQINNQGSQNQIIELILQSYPENWKVLLEGRGRQINQVFVKKGSMETVDLEVEVPENAESADYSLTVSALKGSNILHSLKLNVEISTTPTGEDRLESQYSELKGPSDATFNFKLNLTNNGNKEQTYSLGAQVPDGWQVAFKPSYEQQQVASITVKDGETKGIDFSVTPPANVESGEYTIPVHAVSASGKATEELKIIISGTYEMIFSTPSGRLNADVVAGREQKVTLEVRNNGSAPLNNITFSAQTPEKWSVTFEPETVDVLKPGEERQVNAVISADSKAIAGDYVVSMRASTRETYENADFRVTVKTSTLWGIVGIAIVVLVCAGVYWVFHTYGRR